MKVSNSWLKELVDLKIPVEKLVELLPLRTIGTREVTADFIELDMKGYNRADLLSMRGVALEVAAITNSNISFDNDVRDFIWSNQTLPKVKVEVQDQQHCPIYCVAKIEGLKVETSRKEIVKRLTDCGIRSIDNITDITNLIMLEYGQTMHSFDAAKVHDETMIVRLAKNGEEFQTLDGKLRKLSDEDLLITDPKGILSLSGIMGGKDSEITEMTNTILLEVAIFDPISIRKSSQRFNLASEASKRIQHGLTKKRLLQALDAAIKMYEDLGGKLAAITLIGDFTEQPKIINLSAEKVRNLIGVHITDKDIQEYLEKLYFNLKKVQSGWEVTVPFWRLDIEAEEDLIEEIARMYGYEKIPAQKVPEQKSLQSEDPIFKLIYDLKDKLVKLGLTEVQTYSFLSVTVLEALDFDEQKRKELVKMANPISTETEYMRQNIWSNLVEVAAKNIRNGYKDIAIFEIGKVYYFNEKGEIAEKYCLSIALSNETANPIQELYTIFQKLNIELKLDIVEMEKEKGANLELFHPNRFIQLAYKDKIIGGVAEVHQKVVNNLKIEKRVAVLEIGLNKLL